MICVHIYCMHIICFRYASTTCSGMHIVHRRYVYNGQSSMSDMHTRAGSTWYIYQTWMICIPEQVVHISDTDDMHINLCVCISSMSDMRTKSNLLWYTYCTQTICV